MKDLSLVNQTFRFLLITELLYQHQTLRVSKSPPAGCASCYYDLFQMTRKVYVKFTLVFHLQIERYTLNLCMCQATLRFSLLNPNREFVWPTYRPMQTFSFFQKLLNYEVLGTRVQLEDGVHMEQLYRRNSSLLKFRLLFYFSMFMHSIVIQVVELFISTEKCNRGANWPELQQ